MLLTREAIFAADDLTKELVNVPEWGGDVYLRTLTAGERERWEETNLTRKGNDSKVNLINLQASLVALTAVDEAGVHLFTAADIPALNGKSSVALQRLFSKALELNRVGKQDVEELVKNSETTPVEDSPTA
jgi:hypothetical protein